MALSKRIKVIDDIMNAVVAATEKEMQSTPRQRILDEASEITHKDRNKQYGNPEDNFLNIARIWNGYLLAKGFTHQITAQDVPIMMLLMKAARLATNVNHHDSTVDIAGYAACLGDVQEASRKAAAESDGFMDQPATEAEVNHRHNNERNKLHK